VDDTSELQGVAASFGHQSMSRCSSPVSGREQTNRRKDYGEDSGTCATSTWVWLWWTAVARRHRTDTAESSSNSGGQRTLTRGTGDLGSSPQVQRPRPMV